MSSIFGKITNDNSVNNRNIVMEKMSKTNERDNGIRLKNEDIYKLIPKGASDKENIELAKTNEEWRWRFFNINGRKMVEMSRKKPNSNRIYINQNGELYDYKMSNEWDKYVTKIIYYYAKI
jgi:hypothetical protein